MEQYDNVILYIFAVIVGGFTLVNLVIYSVEFVVKKLKSKKEAKETEDLVFKLRSALSSQKIKYANLEVEHNEDIKRVTNKLKAAVFYHEETNTLVPFEDLVCIGEL